MATNKSLFNDFPQEIVSGCSFKGLRAKDVFQGTIGGVVFNETSGIVCFMDQSGDVVLEFSRDEGAYTVNEAANAMTVNCLSSGDYIIIFDLNPCVSAS